jgi:hypothetical protein
MPCRYVGLGIPGPSTNAAEHYTNSKGLTKMVSKGLTNMVSHSLQHSTDLPVGTYLATVVAELRNACHGKDGIAENALANYVEALTDPLVKHRVQQAKEAVRCMARHRAVSAECHQVVGNRVPGRPSPALWPQTNPPPRPV